MTVNFPPSPSVNDTYTYNGTTYLFDGVKWVSGGATAYVLVGNETVQSVNTRIGDVVLDSADVGAVPATGGTFSGNIEVGTGIDLNADGSATFAGNVGINTTNPNQRLNVFGNAEFNAYDNSGGTGGYFADKGLIIGNAFDAGKSAGDDRHGIIWQERGLDLVFATSDTERMRIDSSGNVLIGGTLPSAPNISLASDGKATFADNVSTTNGVFTSVRSSGAGKAFVGSTGGNENAIIYADGSAEFTGAINIKNAGSIVTELYTNGSAFFTSSVTSGVPAGESGTTVAFTASIGADQNAFIRHDGSAGFAGLITSGPSAPIDGRIRYTSYGTDFGVGGATGFFLAHYATDNLLYTGLKNDGSATFAGTINGTTVGTSDARFKENIAPANPQLDDVVALGGLLKNFDWNEDAPVNEEIRTTRQLGLIAQEAEAICPGIVKTVSRTKDGEEVTPAELDEEGNVTAEAVYEQLDDSYKGISHDALVMKLLGAVAELTAKVEALENA